MSFFIKILSVFAIGCSFGWVLEVLFRRFWSGNGAKHRWINPGFLKGPWLPVYGIGLSALYIFCEILFPLMPNSIIFTALGLLTLSSLLTEIEYLSGLVSKRLFHVVLWDYSGEWGNVDGIICPLFSVFWSLLALGYYFFVHKPLEGLVGRLVINPLFSGILGIYLIAFFLDFLISINRTLSARKEF